VLTNAGLCFTAEPASTAAAAAAELQVVDQPPALSQAQAEAMLQGFESSLDAPLVAAAQQLGLEAQLLGAGGKPVSN
jgi:hypothetical protein